MLALELQWFLLLEMGDVAVAIMIRIMKFSESVVVGRTLYAYVIDPNLLQRRQVIVNDHSAGPDDRHFTNLPRLEPAALDSGETLMAEGQRHIGHVGDLGGDMRVAL